MAVMTSRERVLRTLRFEETDRAPVDIMESIVWPELQEWFGANLGLRDADAVRDHFDLDFRWFWPMPQPPAGIDFSNPMYSMPYTGTYSDHTHARPLAGVDKVDDMLRRHAWGDPAWWDMSPVHELRARNPGRAVVALVHTTMLFMTACDFFGIEEALMRLQTEDEVLLEFNRRQAGYAEALIGHACAGAEGAADIIWLMDDVGTQQGLMMDPALWRLHFKEPLRRQVAIVHRHGMRAMFHSCGAVADILPDLVEIGMDATLPFQTTAHGMDAETIAQRFGGRIAFYGGMDVQHLLTCGSEKDVRRGVRRNLEAFGTTGGYIVANSHHCIPGIQPRNMCAMLDEAHRPRPMGVPGTGA